MGVFIGDSKNTAAAKCGLQINWASKNIVAAKIAEKYPKSTFVLKQRVGICLLYTSDAADDCSIV